VKISAFARAIFASAFLGSKGRSIYHKVLPTRKACLDFLCITNPRSNSRILTLWRTMFASSMFYSRCDANKLFATVLTLKSNAIERWYVRRWISFIPYSHTIYRTVFCSGFSTRVNQEKLTTDSANNF
jgi:hypothetical protein